MTHDESVEDTDRSSFIIRPARPCATEWLLTDYRASTFIVDVEVARGVSQLVRSDSEGSSVGSEDGAGKTVLGGAVDEFASHLEVGVFVDIYL